jgi:cyclopropane-fatty-acyl-phospholipid synthase
MTDLSLLAAKPSAGASTEAIQAHYDVGNDFYALWLDPTQTYSCALWTDDPQDSLEQAQLRKLDYLIGLAGARGKERVLDVGCGWGSTLRRLTQVHGVKSAHGVSLSPEQVRHIERTAGAGMSAELKDWRDLQLSEPVDAIISIGAFEHFARTDVTEARKRETYREFFERCHAWLKPGGCIGLQTISYENSTREEFSDFFREEIFPQSDLPTLTDIAASTERLFEVTELRSDRLHYARTTRSWLSKLRERRGEAVNQVGEAVVQRFERYLQLATIGFHIGSMGLVRVGLRRLERTRPVSLRS